MKRSKFLSLLLVATMIFSPLARIGADEVEVRTFDELKNALEFKNYQDGSASAGGEGEQSDPATISDTGTVNNSDRTGDEATTEAETSGSVEGAAGDNLSSGELVNSSTDADGSGESLSNNAEKADEANNNDTVVEENTAELSENGSAANEESTSSRIVRRDTVEAGNEEELAEAAQTAKTRTIKLMSDIAITGPLKVLANTAVKIVNGLDSVTLKKEFVNKDAYSLGDSMLTVEKGAKLEISSMKNGEINNEGIIIDGLNKENNVSLKGDILTVLGEAVINGLTVQNVYSKGVSSAPIYVDGGNLTVNDIHIKDNTAGYQETIGNSKYNFNNNPASGYINSAGMGVTGKGTITMNGGVIENNSISPNLDNPGFGTAFGTVTANNGTFVMNGGRISDNKAHFGGAIAIVQGQLLMNGGEILRNKAVSYAGALLVDWVSKAQLNGGLFEDNFAATHGGAIVVNDRYRQAANEEGGSKRSDIADY